jgi:hypothetical protein
MLILLGFCLVNNQQNIDFEVLQRSLTTRSIKLPLVIKIWLNKPIRSDCDNDMCANWEIKPSLKRRTNL